MKVAIFETEHFEAAYPLIRLFDKDENQLTVFCYESSYHQLELMLRDKPVACDFIIRKKSQSRISFILTIYREAKKRKIDLLFLNTVTDNFVFYALLPLFLSRTRIILGVHMIHSLFETRKKWKFRRMVRALGKRMLRTRIREFNVISQVMTPYLQGKLPPGKKVHTIPGGVFEKEMYEPGRPHQPLHLVIPGSIDGKRRNYDQAFELLALLGNRQIPVIMTFLGSFYGEYGRKLASRCREWNIENKNLVFYENPVDQPEFDHVLENADFIFSPSVIYTTIDDDVEEKYGLSMSSGNISDVIRHARPFLIPRGLEIDPALEKSCNRYTSLADIAFLLQSIRQDPGLYLKLAEAALEASKEYQVHKIRARNQDVFGNEKEIIG